MKKLIISALFVTSLIFTQFVSAEETAVAKETPEEAAAKETCTKKNLAGDQLDECIKAELAKGSKTE